MLWITFGLLLIFWLICYMLHFGGGFITYFMALSFIILLVRTVNGRRKQTGTGNGTEQKCP